MALDPVSAVIGAVGTAGKLLTLPGSIRSQRNSEKALQDLSKKPMARYTIDPKIEALYSQSIKDASNAEGYGGATINSFRNQLGKTQRGRFGSARSMGGGARGINAVLNSQGLDQINNFAAGNENMIRSNRMSGLVRAQGYASQFQNMRDRNTSFDQNYRMQLERGLGEAIRSQKDYRRNMFSGLGSDLITAGVGGYFGGNKSVQGDVDGFMPEGNAMEGTEGSDYLYSNSGRSGMVNRRNSNRALGWYK